MFVLAALFRVDFFFYLLYLFFGIYFFSRLWSDRVLRQVGYERDFSKRAFQGEAIPVRLRIVNHGLLPVPWLRVHESLPVELKSPNFEQRICSLWPYEKQAIDYELHGRRRGYYRLGPLLIGSGDPFGVRYHSRRIDGDDHVIVYPRIVALAELGLPGHTPFGDVPTIQRMFEDPTRMVGVRDYQPGDTMRRIHWKASAAKGQLQVKRFQPAISIEAMLFLNLNRSEYSSARVETASELAIVTAASIANYVVEKRQAVGLSSNGLDPLSEDGQQIMLPPRKGRGQLIRILEGLARVQVIESRPFVDTLKDAQLHLTWGGLAIVITPDMDNETFDSLILMKRAGYRVISIVMDPRAPFDSIQERSKHVGIAAHQVWTEKDMDVWR